MTRSGSSKAGTKSKKKKTQKAGSAAGRLHGQIDELKADKAGLEDRLLRLAAEFDNYKKRTSREFQQLVGTANENLIVQLVDVLDNFERALESANSAQDFEAFHRGVELIHDHLVEILAKEGLQPIEAVGHAFDPHRHEAMMQMADEDHPADTVVSQMQRGYMLGEKLLRASRVVVSAGPPDAQAEPETHREQDAKEG
jgi:molecular chaperone GrpE